METTINVLKSNHEILSQLFDMFNEYKNDFKDEGQSNVPVSSLVWFENGYSLNNIG
jgi:hypothetical protein